MRITWRAPVAVFTTLVLSACTASDERPADADGPRAFVAEDVHILGSSESLGFVMDLEVLSDGQVWVLNSIEPFFVGFRPDGSVIAEHGQYGGGPNEFGRPVGLVEEGFDGGAWILDLRRHQYTLVSSPEGERRDLALPADVLPPGTVSGGRDQTYGGVRTARVGDEIVLPRSTMTGEPGWIAVWKTLWGADLVAWNPVTGMTRDVVDIGARFGDPTADLEILERPPFPLWSRVWTVCNDREVRVFDRLSNTVRGFLTNGEEVAPVALPEPTLLDVSKRDFALGVIEVAAIEQAGAIELYPPRVDTAALLPGMIQMIEGDGAALAAYLPRYVDMHCSDEGDIWMRPFDLEHGGLKGGLTWLRIRPDGHTQPVTLPERFDPFRFTGGRIWGVQRDAYDVASVAWIEW